MQGIWRLLMVQLCLFEDGNEQRCAESLTKSYFPPLLHFQRTCYKLKEHEKQSVASGSTVVQMQQQ